MLSSYCILDLTDRQGFLCGRILGDLGADVIKVEKPGGDPDRRIGPFYHDTDDPEKSLYWFAYNASKRGITLDLETADGQGIFKRLVQRSDIVLESFAPGYMDKLGLSYSSLSGINPQIIMVSITPFGQTGPYRDYKGCDIVDLAMGGLSYLYGDPDRPPVRISGTPQAYAVGGVNAAIGALMALEYRGRTGEGQHVDVSIQACVARMQIFAPNTWAHAKVLERRLGAYISSRHGPGLPPFRTNLPCKDGYASFSLQTGPFAVRHVYPLIEWMKSEGVTDLPEDINRDTLGGDIFELAESGVLQQLERAISNFLLKYTKAELMEQMERRGFSLMAVKSPGEVFNDAQLSARNFWVQVEHDELGRSITYPGAPAKLSKTPWKIRRRAPLIGEHNQEVYAELSNGEREQEPKEVEVAFTLDQANTKCESALEGVKVLDFQWHMAGPYITSYLGAFGAQVIRVESETRPDGHRTTEPFKDGIKGLNRAYRFCCGNSSKYSMALNMGALKAVEIVKKLVAWADVVTENFSPGAMKKWGLAYEDLRKIKPDIIMMSTSQQGQTGPLSHFAGFGNHGTAASGITHLSGWPDREPAAGIVGYSDMISPLFGVTAVLAALNHRRRTGEGQYIDISQVEATIPMLVPTLLDYSVNKREQSRRGNRSDWEAPHAAYPCKGDDTWCVIAVFNDEEWKNFCRVMGNPKWTRDQKFTTFVRRKENEDELDKLISEWTVEHTAQEVMVLMQEAGVRAGVVQSSQDLVDRDPQLKHRDIFQWLEHPELGLALHYGWPIQLSKSPWKIRAAPCLGEHTAQICFEILGMSKAEFVQLVNEEVLK